MMHDDKPRDAFTLIEALVVITIVGLLVGLLLPAVLAARESVRRSTCASNLRDLGIAVQHHHLSKGAFPTGLVPVDDENGRYDGATNLWVEILPFVDQSPLHKKWDYDDYRNNLKVGGEATVAQVLALLLCPSDHLPNQVNRLRVPPPYDWINSDYAIGCYGGNAGTRSFGYAGVPQSRDGVFFSGSRVRIADVGDGTSQTILLGERSHHDPEYDRLTARFDPGSNPLASWGAWGSANHKYGSQGDVLLSSIVPINYRVPHESGDDNWDWEDWRLSAFGSSHARGANLAFCDGSVRFVGDSTSWETLRALSTRSGNEVLSAP